MPTFCRPVVGHDKSTTKIYDQILHKLNVISYELKKPLFCRLSVNEYLFEKNTEIEILTVSFTEIKISDEMMICQVAIKICELTLQKMVEPTTQTTLTRAKFVLNKYKAIFFL
ncbi:hypothetical protein T01_14114 [Trichinella spiralis]|uniref:Uncharacterized protein n=1 Tax=Trichinella spiralis TaxID=6334 RepID=A0A0V1B4W9_TRISP|nr:hypothetical protein T01_14114 [Trichinella spiralis]